MLTAYAFLGFNFIGYFLSLSRGPLWGLLVYMNIYFNSPRPFINWWASYIPDIRWSLLSGLVLIASIVIHRKKISDCKLHSIKWAVAFLILTFLVTLKAAVDTADAIHFTYKLFTYCITIYCIIKSIKSVEQYRLFLLAVILFATNLSLKAFLYGERIHARLENIGTVDTLGSNEFALLLAGIIPLTLPFIMSGNKYEKIICIMALPLLLNAFILCNSRGALVALVLSVMMVFVFLSDKKIRKAIVVSMLCTIPLFLYLSDDYFFDRAATLLGTNEALGDESELSHLSSGRTEIWTYGMDMVKDYPFGAGPNGFRKLAQFYMPIEVLKFHPGAEFGMRSAHSTYLKLLVEQGVLGLSLFLIMCGHTLFLVLKGLRKVIKFNAGNVFWKYNMVALGLSFSSILIGGFFSSRIYYEFFWWQIALIVVSYSFIMNMDYATSEKSTT